MRELIKLVSKRKLFIIFMLKIIVSLASYGVAFSYKYYVVAPVTHDKIINLLFVLSLLYIIEIAGEFFSRKYDDVAFAEVECNVSKYYFDKITKMEISRFADNHTGYLQSLVKRIRTSFSEVLAVGISCYVPLTIGILTLIYSSIVYKNILSILIILSFVVPIYLRYKMQISIEETNKEVKKRFATYDGTFIDFISNLNTVRKLETEDFALNTIRKKAKDIYPVINKGAIKTAITVTLFNGFTYLVYLFLIISTIKEIRKGNDGVSFFLFYYAVINNIKSNMNQLSRCINVNLKFNSDKKQIDECIGKINELKVIKMPDKIEVIDGVFSYKERSTNISIPNFIIEKGDKVSVMGKSGEGKTTILNILYGMYKLKSGKIIAGKSEFKDKKLDVIFISQEVDLFDLSIRDNLTMGKNIKDEKVLELIDKAGLSEWYKTLPKGLDEFIGERGVKLSAGQRQRLNIIRGILKDGDLYFFDEPTSNLDLLSEEKIIKLIDEYLKDKTYIIVTHRDEIKRLCNKHYVMKKHVMELEECN